MRPLTDEQRRYVEGPFRRSISRRTLVAILVRVKGNREKAAQALGVSVRTVYRRLKELGLDSEADEQSETTHDRAANGSHAATPSAKTG